MPEEGRAGCFASESRKLARNALFMVLSDLACHHLDVDLNDGFKKPPPGADVPAAEEKGTPLPNKVLGVPATSRSRQAQH